MPNLVVIPGGELELEGQRVVIAPFELERPGRRAQTVLAHRGHHGQLGLLVELRGGRLRAGRVGRAGDERGQRRRPLTDLNRPDLPRSPRR